MWSRSAINCLLSSVGIAMRGTKRAQPRGREPISITAYRRVVLSIAAM